jgi:hypothetical protein
VKQIISGSQRAQTQSRAAHESGTIDLSQRLAFSPKEFAALNGRSPTWGYRRIYHGDVKVIANAGRILIPRSEVDAFLARSAEYNPQAKPSGSEKENGGEA